jgi:hypothetical protein
MSTAVIFHWTGPDGKRFQGEGVTRDMSVNGAYVLTPTCPPPNVEVQLEVILPLSDGPSRAQMKTHATVMRVDHDLPGNMHSGFSAVGKGFLLSTSSERASRVVVGLMNEFEDVGDKNEQSESNRWKKLG